MSQPNPDSETAEEAAADASAADRQPEADAAPDPGPWHLRLLGTLGRSGMSAARHLGRAGILFTALLQGLRRPRRWWRETLRQAKLLGVDSVLVVCIMGALAGSVIAQQSGYQFGDTLPPWIIGQSVAAGVISEMAPVLTALVLAGRVGAGIAAELGSMKVTDQLDALRTLGRDPVQELIVPRVLGVMLVSIPLVILSIVVGIGAGWISGISIFPLTTGEYVRGVRDYYHHAALLFALFKGLVFGFTIAFLACYVGFQTEEGAQGVGRSATAAAVVIIVAVLILDAGLAPVYKAIK